MNFFTIIFKKIQSIGQNTSILSKTKKYIKISINKIFFIYIFIINLQKIKKVNNYKTITN
jgi:hypothetical protein